MIEPDVKICYVHVIKLNDDGTCPECRDLDGKPFVLNEKEYYLVTPGWWAVLQKRKAEAEV